MQTIGFIGLGKMGGNMAARYLAAGHVVYGEARNRKGAQWLIDQGLRWVDTPREVAEAAGIIMTSLPNASWISTVPSGVKKCESPFRCDLNNTPSSVIFRRLSRLKT